MTTYASDSFDRANSSTTLGNSDGPGSLAWTVNLGTWGILNNFGYFVTGTNDAHNNAYLAVGQSNVTVSVAVGLSPVTDRIYAGLRLRETDANNWMVINIVKISGTNGLQLDEVVGGSYGGPLATAAGTFVETGTYVLKAVISGSTVAIYVDDVLKIAPTTFSNASLTGQNYGINVFKGASNYDNGQSYFNDFLVTDNASTFTGYPRPQQAVYRM